MIDLEIRRAAKSLYIDGMSLERIAKELNVTARAIFNWKKSDGNWEFARQAH